MERCTATYYAHVAPAVRVENVPALRCEDCGETAFSVETVGILGAGVDGRCLVFRMEWSYVYDFVDLVETTDRLAGIPG